ncbi:MAG: RnfABCDGE type electron transport complex subunit B [Candidatus Woesearchaeota archaeon]
MIQAIMTALITAAVIALLLAISLAFASKRFVSKEDPKVDSVFEVLPQSNCGACGFPSCSEFAKALVHDPKAANHCRLGGKKVLEDIETVLGVKVQQEAQMFARVLCKSGSKEKFDYHGIRTCKAASLLSNGPKSCAFSCIGFGDCLKVCQFGAISMKDSLPVIDDKKCTGCDLCVAACPKSVLMLSKATDTVFVACHNQKKEFIKSCSNGCIACGLCVKACKSKAISIDSSCAKIDPAKCNKCLDCVKVCPRKVIQSQLA